MPTSRSLVRLATAAAATAAVLVSAGSAAVADDHLFNGATSPGADQRGVLPRQLDQGICQPIPRD